MYHPSPCSLLAVLMLGFRQQKAMSAFCLETMPRVTPATHGGPLFLVRDAAMPPALTFCHLPPRLPGCRGVGRGVQGPSAWPGEAMYRSMFEYKFDQRCSFGGLLWLALQRTPPSGATSPGVEQTPPHFVPLPNACVITFKGALCISTTTRLRLYVLQWRQPPASAIQHTDTCMHGWPSVLWDLHLHVYWDHPSNVYGAICNI